jgi:hypothetical protein
MGIEAFVFFGLVFLVLLLLAWRTGVFRRGVETPLDGSGAYPQIQPGGRSGESIRDPRARVPDGDKLGRR